ncbi:helix-turn-helix domain-containing protein [Prevotella sp.]
MSPVTISKWCSNTTQPTLQTLDKIAEMLEIDMRELLTSN